MKKKKMQHVSFDRVKIKGDHCFVKGLKLWVAKCAILEIGGQNRKFVKLGGKSAFKPKF